MDFELAARMLATGGLDPNFSDQRNVPLLAYAARLGDEATVRLLLCAGAKINGSDAGESSPLIHAVMAQQDNIVAVLLRAGASATQQRADRESALTLAVRIDSTSVLHSILASEIGLLINHRQGETLLALAVQCRSMNVAKELLRLGADLPDPDGRRALALCAKKGDLKGTRFLLAAGADPDNRSYDGHTAFTLAAANGHIDVVEALLTHRRQKGGANPGKAVDALLKQADHHGRTVLMMAVLNKHTDMVEYLLKQGADLHSVDINGMNALLWAVAKSTAAMVNLIFNYRATHRLFDRAGNSGIMIAASYGNLATLKVLLTPLFANDLFDINTPNKAKDTALTIAAARGHEDIVRELLQEKANVLCVNAAGRSAKMEAAMHGHTEIVDLLEAAEQVALKAFQPTTGILAALTRIPALGAFLPNFSSVKIPEVDAEGNSVLALAALHGHTETVIKLTEAGRAELETSYVLIEVSDAQGPSGGDDNNSWNEDDNQVTPAAKPAKANLVDINRENRLGLTPLCMAINTGREDIARLLVECNASVNHAGQSGITPLWLAATMPEYRPKSMRAQVPDFVTESADAILEMLIDSGADVNAASIHAQTPLHAAAISGRLATVKILVGRKADIHLMDKHGISALGHAAKWGRIEIVQYLLSQGGKLDVPQGMHAPFLLAAANGHDAIVLLLARYGADVQHSGVGGRTALIAAACNGKASTVALLLKLGANLHHVCEEGRTALEHARKRGHMDIVALLKAGHPAPSDN